MDHRKIITRARNLLFQPELEWKIIQTEPNRKEQLVREYAVPLTIMVGGSALLGGIIFHSGYGVYLSYIISSILISLVVSFGGMYLSALVINELTTGFDSRKDIHATMALVIYSYTAFFVSYAASCLLNIPPLNSLLGLCGLYTLYLFWTGLTPMLGTPTTRKPALMIVSVLVMTGIYIALRFLMEAIFSGPLLGKSIYNM
jgi:hypothetical protein